MASKASKDYSRIVQVRVGQGLDQTPFFHPPSELRKSSLYFRKELEKEWGGEGMVTIDLLNESPPVFKCYLDFLSSDSLDISLGDTRTNLTIDTKVTRICSVYFAGLRLEDAKFRNAALRMMAKVTTENKTVPTCCVERVYRNTTITDPLRKLIVDLIARHGRSDVYRTFDGMPKEFLFDLLNEVVEFRVIPNDGEPDLRMERYLLPEP